MNFDSFPQMNSIDYENKINSASSCSGYYIILSDYQEVIQKEILIFFKKNKKVKEYKEIHNINGFLNFLIKYKNYINEENKENIFLKSFSWSKNSQLLFLKEIYYLSNIKISYNCIYLKSLNRLNHKEFFVDNCNLKFQEYLKQRRQELIKSKCITWIKKDRI